MDSFGRKTVCFSDGPFCPYVGVKNVQALASVHGNQTRLTHNRATPSKGNAPPPKPVEQKFVFVSFDKQTPEVEVRKENIE